MNDDEIEAEYVRRRGTPSDINEHFPTLSDYASHCETLIEFGTRTGNSTVALLRGLNLSYGRVMKTIDIDPNATAHVAGVLGLDHDGDGWVGETKVEALTANTLQIEIETPVDMIFIDTLHTYHQLKQELIRHGNKAKKYLAFHDTYTFGEQGEDGTTPGLNQAIDEFIENSLRHLGVRWEKVYVSRANNGLTVLERLQIGDGPAKPISKETPVSKITKFDEIEEKVYDALEKVVEGGGAYEVGRAGKATTLKVIWSVLIPGQEKPSEFVYSGASDKGLAAALGGVTAVIQAHIAGLQKVNGLLGS